MIYPRWRNCPGHSSVYSRARPTTTYDYRLVVWYVHLANCSFCELYHLECVKCVFCSLHMHRIFFLQVRAIRGSTLILQSFRFMETRHCSTAGGPGIHKTSPRSLPLTRSCSEQRAKNIEHCLYLCMVSTFSSVWINRVWLATLLVVS